MREGKKVCNLDPIEAQNFAKAAERTDGWLNVAPLFQPSVPTDADASQYCHLLSTQAGRAPLSAGQAKVGSCPTAWCSFPGATTITGLSRDGQAARVGRLTRGSLPIGAMLSSVM